MIPLRWLLAAVGAACLAYGSATYLMLKSDLPALLCVAGGLLLAAPILLVVRRPLLAWNVALAAALVTGLAVQAHGKTPFSWHPAVLAAQTVILVIVVLRLPVRAVLWAGLSMAALITVSFYPADVLPLIALVGAVLGVAGLVRFGRNRTSRRTEVLSGVGTDVYPASSSS